MTRLSTRAREELYDAEARKALEAGRGPLPICRICDCPIDGVKSAWDENHAKEFPKWLGGPIDGISHRRCNRAHNNRVDTPRYAKSRRQRQMNIGAKTRQGRPMAGTRDSNVSKRFDGSVIERSTGKLLFGGRR